jgi:hypothetical protein
MSISYFFRGNLPPSVSSLTLTPASVTSGASVTMTCAASDLDGSVASVEYFLDGVSKGTSSSPGTNFALTFTATAVGNNRQTQAQATDNLGIKSPLSMVAYLSVIGASGLPSQVSGLTLSLADNSSLTASWTAPANGGSPITDYLIEYSSNGGSTYSPFVHPASTALSQTISGLTATTSYAVRVSAINSSGTGLASNLATAATTTTPPAAIVYHPAYQSVKTAIEATGATLTVAQHNVGNRLVRDLNGEANSAYATVNVWADFVGLYGLVGGTAASHAINWKNPGTFNLGFTTGFTHSNLLGSTSDGTAGAYANTGIVPATNLSQNALTLIAYVFFEDSNYPWVPLGASNASYANGCYLLANFKSNNYSRVNNNDVGPWGNYSGGARGLQILTRTSGTSRAVYLRGSLLSSDNTAALTPTSFPLYGWAVNNGGTSNNQFGSSLGLLGATNNGMNAAQAAAVTAAVNAFTDGFGRSAAISANMPAIINSSFVATAANQITFAASITPTTTPMEVSINAGSSFVSVPFSSSGANQQGILTGVPAATYAPNQLVMRAVGYPATAIANSSSVTVSGTGAAAPTVTSPSFTAA